MHQMHYVMWLIVREIECRKIFRSEDYHKNFLDRLGKLIPEMQTVKARTLLCFCAHRNLGMTFIEIGRRLNISRFAVSPFIHEISKNWKRKPVWANSFFSFLSFGWQENRDKKLLYLSIFEIDACKQVWYPESKIIPNCFFLDQSLFLSYWLKNN